MKEDKCDGCGKVNSLVIKQHEGTMVCVSCGLIHKLSMIDQTNEKRVFSNDLQGADQSASRVQVSGNRFMPQHD